MKVSLTEQVSRCSTEGHHWSHHPCSDPHSSFQPCTIYIPLWHMLRWHHCSSLNPIVHCLSSAVFPMGPWPVRGKGHCKYCAKILPAPPPPPPLSSWRWNRRAVGEHFLPVRGISVVKHQTGVNPSMSKIATVRSFAGCWHYRNLRGCRIF